MKFSSTGCRVVPISYATAQEIIKTAHYIGKLGSTSVALGMLSDDRLIGVMTFGTIPGPNAQAVCGLEHANGVLELTRLALYDDAPRNSESWFIGQAFRWLTQNRPDVTTLISYAENAAGHCGTIYQATNWTYTGQTTGDYVYECEDGTVMHPRTIGWDRNPLPVGRFRPSGVKHRYVIFLGSAGQRRRLQRLLRWPALPYPKLNKPGRHVARPSEQPALFDVGTVV